MSKVMVSLILAVFLAGCAGSPIQTEWEAGKNRKAMLHLKIGMTKVEVQNIMGEPRRTEAYSKDGRNIEFWLYMTEAYSNFTPLAFEDGKLIGWGRNFYDKTLKYEHKIEIK